MTATNRAKDDWIQPALPPHMDAAGTSAPAADVATGLADVPNGWDEHRGSAERITFPKPWWRRWQWRQWLSAGVVLLVVLAIGAAVAIPNMLASKYSPYENSGVQNLKALATAQAQYIKKYDSYADAGWRLNVGGTLIAADLKNAFEDWQMNGDNLQPQPKAGYIYRMLHGDELRGPHAFYRDPNDPDAGMTTWAATCRAANPGVSDENQYYITEAGTVYKFAEPPPGDPQYKQFLLDRQPPHDQTKWPPAK